MPRYHLVSSAPSDPAGILTPGSSSIHAFPPAALYGQWHNANIVTGHSGGPVPDLHGGSLS